MVGNPATIFISHSSKDEAVVRWLVAHIEQEGHKAWVAEWDIQVGSHLTEEITKALANCDAYIILLTESGYDSIYVSHETGAAVASGKPVIALVDKALSDEPLGLLTDIVQVRFDRDDLAASSIEIRAGLQQLAVARGVQKSINEAISIPTQPELFQFSVQMSAQFQVTPEQVLVGVCALLLIGGLIYLSSKDG